MFSRRRAEVCRPRPPLPRAAPRIEADVVIVRGTVDRSAVDLPAAGPAVVVPVNLLLVDFMQDRDLAAVKAELPANPVQGLIIGHVAGRPARDSLDQLRVLRLGNILRALVGLPFQLLIKLSLDKSQPALILRAALLEGLVYLQDLPFSRSISVARA